MAGIHFDITADSRQMVDTFNKIKSEMGKLDAAMKAAEKSLNFNFVEKSILKLKQEIQANEAAISKSSKELEHWASVATKALEKGDQTKFGAATQLIEEESKKIADLTKKTQEYKSTLTSLGAVDKSGLYSGSVTAPKLFQSKEDYDSAEALRAKIQELQEQIHNFEGSDEDLQALRDSLSQNKDELNAVELKAAQTALEFGKMGRSAAESSTRLYQLTDEITKQGSKCKELEEAVEGARKELERLKEEGNSDEIREAQEKYDMLSDSLQNNHMRLINLAHEYKETKKEVKESGTAFSNLSGLLSFLPSSLGNYAQSLMSFVGKAQKGGSIIKGIISSTEGLAGSIQGAAGASAALSTAAVATAAGVAAVGVAAVAAAQKLHEYNIELARQQEITKVTTGLSGEAADKLTAGARALARTYNVDFRNAIDAANTLIQQFGLSGDEALATLKDGMQGMIQGDGAKLLNMIQAYSPAFRDAGISASELVAVIQNTEGGIFTDQNMSAIVMGIKNIRLMTDATKDSLKGLGIDAEDMEKKLDDGSMSIFEALKMVAGKIGDVGSGSKAAGEVMQQVFGRQGTMAGTKLGEAINTLNINLNETKAQTGEVGESLRELNEAHERLEKTMMELFEIDGWDEMARTFETNLINDLEDVFSYFNEIKIVLKDIYDSDVIGKITKSVYLMLNPLTGIRDLLKEIKGMGEEETEEEKPQPQNAYKVTTDRNGKVVKATRVVNGKEVDDTENYKKAHSEPTTTTITSTTTPTDTSQLRRQQASFKELVAQMKAERERAVQDLHFSTAQAEIDAMEESNEKTTRQIELDFAKNEIQIQRWYENLANKKVEEAKKLWDADPGTKDKPFDPTSVDTSYSPEEDANYEARIKANEAQKLRSIAEIQKSEVQAMRDYLAEYGTCQQKKLALAEEYAERIRKAQTEGERLTLEKERDQRIGNVNLEAIRQTIDWASVFGGFSGMLQDEIKSNIEAIREYMKSDEFKGMAPTDQATIVNALNELKSQASGSLSDINIKEVGELTTKFQEAQQAMLQAKEDEAKAYERLKTAQENYEKAQKTGNSSFIRSAEEELEAAESYAQGMSNVYQTAESNFTATGNELKEATSKAVDAIDAVSNAISQIKSGSLQGAYEGIKNLSGSLQDVAKGGMKKVLASISDAMGSGVGQIVSVGLALLDLLKDGIGALIANLTDMVFNAVNGVLSDILSGNIVTKLVDSLKNGITNIMNTVTFGGFDKAMGSVFGGNADKVAAANAALTARNEKLQAAIEDLTDAMNNASPTEAIDLYNRSLEYQKEIQKNELQRAKNQASYHSAHHSFNYYWDGYTDKEIKAFSEQINRAWSGDIWNLSPEEMKLLRSNVEMWDKIEHTGKAGYGQWVADALDGYIQQAGAIEEINDRLIQTLTETSFDSLYDNFVSTLMEMDANAEDFAEDFEGYMKKAIIQSLTSTRIKPLLDNWLNAFSAYVESGGNLTPDEVERLRSGGGTYRNRVTDKDETFLGWNEITEAGLNLIKELDQFAFNASMSAEDKSATASMADKATYDQFELYLGIATAQQISLEQGNEQRQAILDTLTSMQALASGRDEELTNLVNISNEYLLDIKKSNRQILDSFGEKMDDIKELLESIL